MQTKKIEEEKENLENKEIKEALHRIESALEEGKKITLQSIFSGFCMAVGLVLVSCRISDDPTAVVSGKCLFAGGGVILCSAVFRLSGIKRVKFLSDVLVYLGLSCVIIGILWFVIMYIILFFISI